MSRRSSLAESLEPMPVAESPPAPSFWSAVREALHGSMHDYTEGPLGRAILLLAIPMVLEMIMESIFAVVDVFWVAHLGADAVATVGLTETLMTLVYTLAMGLSIGAMALVARRVGEHHGERHPDAAAETAVQALALGALVSAALGVAGALLAPRLLALLGAEPAVVARGAAFTRVMLGGNATVFLLFLINAVFRGAGDPALAMRALWLANGINIVLGPCFIFGPGPFPALGVTGAAVATNIGRGVGLVYALRQLFREGSRVRVERRHLRLEPAVMGRLLRLSSTGTLQVLIGSASWIGLVRILSAYGSAVLAGYTIGIRVVLFALLPSWGLSNAAATMVGQSLGAGKPERAERAVWMAGFYNLCFLGAVGVLFVLAAGPLIRLFTTDPAVARTGADALRVIAFGLPVYAYGMVFAQSFNGAGDTTTPTLLNLVVFWLFEIPLAAILADHLGFGPHGVFLAITIAFSSLALAGAVLFRRGKWKTKRV